MFYRVSKRLSCHKLDVSHWMGDNGVKCQRHGLTNGKLIWWTWRLRIDSDSSVEQITGKGGSHFELTYPNVSLVRVLNTGGNVKLGASLQSFDCQFTDKLVSKIELTVTSGTGSIIAWNSTSSLLLSPPSSPEVVTPDQSRVAFST